MKAPPAMRAGGVEEKLLVQEHPEFVGKRIRRFLQDPALDPRYDPAIPTVKPICFFVDVALERMLTRCRMRRLFGV